MTRSTNDVDLSAGVPLALDEFIRWVRETIATETKILPSTRLSEFLGEDIHLHFLIFDAVDRLTGLQSDPTTDIMGVVTVRDLYWYYLYVLSRPRI